MDLEYHHGSSIWCFCAQCIWCDQTHLSEVAKWLNHYAVHYEGRNDEFSCKFKNTQSKKILQILKESFGTFEDVSSAECQSFEKKKRKVHVSRARAMESELTKKFYVNLTLTECFFCKKLGYWKRNYPLSLVFLDPNRLMKRN